MKESRFTDGQITADLKRAETGEAVPALGREVGIGSGAYSGDRDRPVWKPGEIGHVQPD